MKIYIGADHRGFHLKQSLIDYLRLAGHDVIDEGDRQLNPDDDFPQFAGKVVAAMLAEGPEHVRGLLLCGSGQGMCMAANRFKHIRATLGYSMNAAKDGRTDENSNVLCLPVDDLNSHQAQQIVDMWLSTPFAAAPRYVRRIHELDNM